MTIDAHPYNRRTREGPVSPFAGSDSVVLGEKPPWETDGGPTSTSEAAPPWETEAPATWESWGYQRTAIPDVADAYERGLVLETAPPWAPGHGGPGGPVIDGYATQSFEVDAEYLVNGYLDEETEALLDEIWDSARSLAERTLIRRAIAKGTRSENELTDLVFFRRHPDRNGRSVSRSELNFQVLADEWLQIRDTLVRPTLREPAKPRRRRRPSGRGRGDSGRRPATGQPPTPSTGGDSGEWASKRSELVRITQAELTYWGNGSVKENQQKGWERVERYWDESLGWTPDNLRGSSLATSYAWSGVFISWVVAQAGIGKDLWEPWSNHSGYLVLLMRKAAHQSDFPITVLPPYSVALRPGDMVNNWRDASKPYDLEELQRWVTKSETPTFAGHTDIVTNVVPGSYAEKVGGNLSESVKKNTIAVDGNGVLVPKNDLVAVIRMGQ